jgi:glycosyltransferase involved in cell wall biosynthesis
LLNIARDNNKKRQGADFMKTEKKRKLKIVLFLSPFPPPFGGVATLTKTLFEKGLPEPYIASVIDTKRLITKNDSCFNSLVNHAYREIMIIIRLLYNLIFRRPHVIHLNCSVSPVGVHRDLFCIVLSRLIGVPTISHYHGNIGDFGSKVKYYSANLSIKLLMKLNFINIFSNIPSLRSAVTRFGLKEDPERNYIIPNYASDRIWKYEHKVIEKKFLTCAFLGNLCLAKGTDLIVKIAKTLPDIQFDLIGKIGRDVEDLLSFHKSSNIKIFQSMDQIEAYKHLESTDVFLFPSLTEGFPLSVVEAMSIGLPVVCTPVGSLPEMIDEGKGGYIVDVGDSESFSRAIIKLVNSDLRKRMGLYNRSKAMRKYKFDSVVKRLVDGYNKIS